MPANMPSTNNVYLSFGENCLPDDILKRHGLKSFSSPYASGRSNIEYILQIEEDHFRNFLNRDYIRYEPFGQQMLPRLKHYDQILNRYDPLHMNGFEFTHHDVLSDDQQLKTFERRCSRQLELRGKNLFIFYHHRFCKDTDWALLTAHLQRLRKIYLSRCPYVEVILFVQKLVSSAEERRVEHTEADGIHTYTFYTQNLRGGNDQNIFWARCDDDLVRIMLDDVRLHTPKTTLLGRLLRRLGIKSPSI